MDRLKKVRTVRRRAYTQTYNKVADILSSEESNPIAIEGEFNLLREKREELRALDDQIFNLMLEEDADEDSLQREVSATDEISSKYNVLQIKVADALKQVEKSRAASESSSSITSISFTPRKYRLPLLELKKFSGDVKEWLQFWAQFSKIDEDASLDPSDKFQYLLQATIEGSRAREVVNSYPATSENYPKAVEALKTRFGREDVLVEVYVRELLSLVLQASNPTSRMSLCSLYDRLESYLRALETLKVTTDRCEAMLFPLMESCLPEELLRAWQRSLTSHAREVNASNRDTGKARLTQLLEFLRSEVEGEQRISMAMAGFGLRDTDQSAGKGTKRIVKGPARNHSCVSEDIPTAAGLLTTAKDQRKCIFCSSGHNSQDCIKAQSSSLTDRRQVVDRNKGCFCCLKPGHTAKKCKNKPKCIVCGKPHFVIMCGNLPQIQDHNKLPPQDISPGAMKQQTDEVLASLSHSCDVQMQTLVVNIRSDSYNRPARALIDTASQRSYILSSTAAEMGYQPNGKEMIQHSLFGGCSAGVVQHNVFSVHLSSTDNKYGCHFQALDQDRICGNISPIKPGPWIDELSKQNISLSDLECSGPIDILIGADIAGKILTGGRRLLTCGLVAIETKLGWTLMGKFPTGYDCKDNLAMVVTSMFIKDAALSDLWTLDTLRITDPSEKLNKIELQAAVQQHFNETVTITEEGRYEVHLPWNAGYPTLPDNYSLALKRTNSTVKKLKAEGLFDAYQQVLDEWISEGVIEEVPPQDMHLPGHYLPHRHVVKMNSTTPVRPVFDASARDGKNPSLNQCLDKGPNLIEKIPAVLARFRLKKIGVVGDIRRAFLQISLCTSDRNFLRFLWITEEGVLKVYRHCRVVFGVSSSPFLLEACLNLHLETTLDHCKEGILAWPISLVKELAHSFYVDNCVSSLNDEEQAQEFISLATSVMRERQFELRGWEMTSPAHASIPVNVLGLLWDPSADMLKINVENLPSETERVTKKTMLSAAHRIFYPIGVVCSVTLIPKLLLQKTWEKGIPWDQEVDAEIQSQFLSWLKSVSDLKHIRIPRWLPGCNERDTWTLHIFSDACQTSYAAAAFLRVEQESGVRIQLVTAKARVSPISKPNKKITIPRLELLAATIAARMYTSIIDDFSMEKIETIFWTDATTVLAWVKRQEPWDVFPFNRVKEIRELTSNCEWRHVPGHMNPADLPSRGCSARKLLETRWWEGPDWLKEPESLWPKVDPAYDEEEIGRERKKTIVSSMICGSGDKDWYYRYFSHYKKIVRLVGWILRFWTNCKRARNERIYQDLTADEYKLAESKIVFLIQDEAFSGVFDPRLSNLLPFIDENGVIRLMTKISNKKDINEFRHPAVLPNHDHPVVRRMITNVHQESCHAGVQIIMSILREQFWILGGRQTVRMVLNSCLRCKRHTAKKVEVIPTPLPENRVRNAKVFEITGVDMAGPLYLKSGKDEPRKAWICLFTCGVYRAVHLELVSSLSTDSFLLAFRRFLSRRGRPHTVYSDRGTNFTGTDNALRKLDWTIIQEYSSVRKIGWKFNPPAAPWWGGWWERLVAIIKKLLRRVLGRASVDYEEMQTILCDCESIINSRPLTYVSQDPMDLTPLTPSMFLQDVEDVGVPDFDLLEATDLNRRLQYRHKLRQNLRERFRSEYLGQLQLLANKKKVREISVGEIVLVGSDNQKRLDWPLARVTELIKGKDGHVRVVRVKTSAGELVRPVQRIYPLELELKPDSNSQLIGGRLRDVAGGSIADVRMSKEKTATPTKEIAKTGNKTVVTRSGRMVTHPKRLDL